MKSKKSKRINDLLLKNNIQLTPISGYPKSDHYREELTELLGRTVTLTADYVRNTRETVYDRRVNNILLRSCDICHKIKGTYHADHIWVTVPKGFMQQNNISLHTKVTCTGYLYEYISKNIRNIGFKLYSIDTIDKKELEKL